MARIGKAPDSLMDAVQSRDRVESTPSSGIQITPKIGVPSMSLSKCVRRVTLASHRQYD